MERFAVKGIFVDTPTPDTLRVRDGYSRSVFSALL